MQDLKSYVSRMDSVNEMLDAAKADKKALRDEMKADGVDLKVFDQAYKLLMIDESTRDQESSMVETYLNDMT